jgi:hypothetical protein
MKQLKKLVGTLLDDDDENSSGYNLGVLEALQKILFFDKVDRAFLKAQLIASLDVIKNIVPSDARTEAVPEDYYAGYADALIEAIEQLEKLEKKNSMERSHKL